MYDSICSMIYNIKVEETLHDRASTFYSKKRYRHYSLLIINFDTGVSFR